MLSFLCFLALLKRQGAADKQRRTRPMAESMPRRCKAQPLTRCDARVIALLD
jgi:hypothetical protein